MQDRSVNIGGSFTGVANTGDNSTIVNQIKDSNKSINDEIANILTQIAAEVEKTQNVAASVLWKNFTDELKESQPNKSKLRQFWDGLISVVPGITTLATAIDKIKALF